MPTIPDYQAVGVASPSGRYNPARASGASPVASALGDVGQVIGKIADEKYKQQTDLAVATAKNEHLRNTVDLANKVQEDPNYNNWQKNFDDAADQSVSDTAANISDPRARQEFELQAQAENIRSSASIAAKARAKFVETKRTGINQTVQENLKSALATDDQETQNSIIVGTNQILSAARADGTITPEEHATMGKSFMESFGKAKAALLDPDARLKYLQNGETRDANGQIHYNKTGTPADFLPDVERRALVEKTQKEIQTDAIAAEVEQRRQIAAADKAKRDASEEAAKGYTSQLILDPTKVSPQQIAKDPALTDEQMRVLLNMHDEQIKKRAGGDPLEGKHGAGFWNAYKGVTGPGPDRITDPYEIYKRAGPGGDLTLADADKLVAIQKEQVASESRGDGDAAASTEFYRDARRKMITLPGSTDQEDAYHLWFQKTHARDMELKKTMNAGQRYSPDGELAKTIKPPPVDDSTFIKPAPPPEPGIVSRAASAVGGFFAGTAAANKARAEPKTTEEIVASYKAGHITRDAASAMLAKLGHPLKPAAPSLGLPQVAPLQ